MAIKKICCIKHKEIEMSVKKYKSWKSNALAKAKNKFQALKEIQKKK